MLGRLLGAIGEHLGDGEACLVSRVDNTSVAVAALHREVKFTKLKVWLIVS
jgi:hypothetical protein